MPSNDQFDRAVSGHIARNKSLVELIASKGADLGEVRIVDLHFWASDELAAKQLAASLADFGATNILFNRSNDDDVWNVEGQYRVSVNTLVSREVVERLVSLALSHNSSFDGWGTSLGRRPNSA